MYNARRTMDMTQLWSLITRFYLQIVASIAQFSRLRLRTRIMGLV